MRRSSVVPAGRPAPRPAPAPSTPRTTKLGFHEGNILELVAAKYSTLREAVLEAAQNAIDAGAKKLNININQQTRSIFVHDNGKGASVEYFNKAISCIGESRKVGGVSLSAITKLGQFGLGVVSAFAKCELFTFSSRPVDGSNGLVCWTFETAKLKGVKGELSIPIKDRPVQQDQWWNSELMIQNYTTDQLRSRIDMDLLCEQIQDRYNDAMQAHGTVVVIKLTNPSGQLEERILRPVAYTGTPIPTRVYTGELAGETSVQLYVARPKAEGRRQVRSGRVKVVDSTGYGIALPNRPSAAEPVLRGLLAEQDMARLTSGMFEGEIRFSSMVRVEASRRYFEQTEALLEACGHVEEWMEKVGQTYITKIENEATTERYNRLGETSLKVLRGLLKDTPELANIVSSFKYGSIGREHADTDGERDGSIVAKSIDGTGERRGPRCGGEKSDDEAKERKPHQPMTVAGAKGGQPRTRIKDGSFGLTLQHGTVSSSNLWHLDEVTGVLTINIMHNTWEACDSIVGRSASARDASVCALQDAVISEALQVMLARRELGADETGAMTYIELYAERSVKIRSFFITEGDRLAQRGQYVDRRGPERKAAQEASKAAKEASKAAKAAKKKAPSKEKN